MQIDFTVLNISAFNIITWILTGSFIAFITRNLDFKHKEGFSKTIIFALYGSLTGGFIGSILFGVGTHDFSFEGLVSALEISLLLTLTQRLIFLKRNYGAFFKTLFVFNKNKPENQKDHTPEAYGL